MVDKDKDISLSYAFTSLKQSCLRDGLEYAATGLTTPLTPTPTPETREMIDQVSTTRQTAENTKPQDNTKHNAEVKDQRPEPITPYPLTLPLSPTPESEEPETNE